MDLAPQESPNLPHYAPLAPAGIPVATPKQAKPLQKMISRMFKAKLPRMPRRQKTTHRNRKDERRFY